MGITCQGCAHLERQFFGAVVTPWSVDEDLIVAVDLKGEPEQLVVSVVVGNPTGPEAIGEQPFSVHVRQGKSSGCPLCGLPGMICGYPCDFEVVLGGCEGGASIHRHLDRPIPVHPVTFAGDGDVRRSTAVHAAFAAGDRDGTRLGCDDQPVGGNKDVVRVHPEARSSRRHLHFVDIDLELESAARVAGCWCHFQAEKVVSRLDQRLPGRRAHVRHYKLDDSGRRRAKWPLLVGWSARGSVGVVSSSELEPTQWKILGDRLVDENPFIRLSIASVELPDGTKFEQYVMRMRRTATTVVLDERDRVLLMWRHRFITDQWVWELPGGYVDQAEDPAAAAAREVEEETGWRPLKKPEFVMTFQPMIGNADSPQDLYFAKGAVEVGRPDANETRRVAWVPLNDAVRMIKEGEIAGAGSVIGIYYALAMQHGLG
jgi:8-oxo-dGTP pyrophosphatase MutT (NUDIX family)